VEFTRIDLAELRYTMSYGKSQIKKEDAMIKKEGIKNEGERNSRQKKLS